MHSCGMSKDGCYYQIDCSHKLGRENVWKVFAVEKKKGKKWNVLALWTGQAGQNIRDKCGCGAASGTT